jgi:hypothetical protein
MTTSREVLTFSDLSPFLLLKNGNYLYKVPFRGGWAVLKVYYDSRTPLARLQKSVANILGGQTSYQPRARLRVERECLELWRRHGFRVFEVYDDAEVHAPGCPEGGYILLEYVEAPKMVDFIIDDSIPDEERFAVYRRFLKEWSRRHELAIALREPRLVHENGDLKHVFIVGDGFLWFDFEMVYRHGAKVEYYVAHEILQYLWQVLRKLSPERSRRLLEETVAHYPVKERLSLPYLYFLHHPNPLARLARWIDHRFRERGRKPTSKYHVARRLKECLGA